MGNGNMDESLIYNSTKVLPMMLKHGVETQNNNMALPSQFQMLRSIWRHAIVYLYQCFSYPCHSFSGPVERKPSPSLKRREGRAKTMLLRVCMIHKG